MKNVRFICNILNYIGRLWCYLLAYPFLSLPDFLSQKPKLLAFNFFYTMDVDFLIIGRVKIFHKCYFEIKFLTKIKKYTNVTRNKNNKVDFEKRKFPFTIGAKLCWKPFVWLSPSQPRNKVIRLKNRFYGSFIKYKFASALHLERYSFILNHMF